MRSNFDEPASDFCFEKTARYLLAQTSAHQLCEEEGTLALLAAGKIGICPVFGTETLSNEPAIVDPRYYRAVGD